MKKPHTIAALVFVMLMLCHCATTGGGGKTSAPFVNSLGMRFVSVPGTGILMCTTETTVAQYQAAGMGYHAPQYPQGSNHPAVNMTLEQANAWCAWLSRKEGRKYRLPTDAEWSAAVNGGTYPWGSSWPPPNQFGNYCGQEFKSDEAVAFAESQGAKPGEWEVIGGFADRHVFTAPVGSYPANHLGIHDLGGNVWEWCGDWHPQHKGRHRVLRGGSWYDNIREYLQSSFRSVPTPGLHYNDGFRVVAER
jgi:formylglycine-generating enzyme required for sulfatase activity